MCKVHKEPLKVLNCLEEYESRERMPETRLICSVRMKFLGMGVSSAGVAQSSELPINCRTPRSRSEQQTPHRKFGGWSRSEQRIPHQMIRQNSQNIDACTLHHGDTTVGVETNRRTS